MLLSGFSFCSEKIMKKDCYISSIKLDDKSVYSYLVVNEKEKIEDAKIGEFHISRPNKACMFVTDILTKKNIEDDLIFHLGTFEAYDYVSKMRDVKIVFHSKNIRDSYLELTKDMLKEYVNMNYRNLIHIIQEEWFGRR